LAVTPSLSRDPSELLDQALLRHRAALARLITMIEGGGDEARRVAALSYASPPPYSVGLTGAPGAGKSTLTDRLITASKGGWLGGAACEPEPIAQLAVVAVDPSSPFTGGAILGDRIRMHQHATDPDVFIRSMATRGRLGGLSLAVPDAVRLLGAAGMAFVLIETVGVGQMEVDVASAADTTVVVVTPGWGDSMQANKAGLLEVADVFVVNKADRGGAYEARRDLDQMLDLSHLGSWRPPIIETSAAEGAGIDELWATLSEHRAHLISTGELEPRRRDRLARELRRVLSARLAERVEHLAEGDAFTDQVTALVAGKTDPYAAAELLLS
jgi:LAO/AO transport system kinase